jgi:chromate transporter
MSPVVVYLLLLKATMTSFSGLGSLALIHTDFVEQRHVLTDHQLNTAVVAGRTGPGPNGVYVVSVGYLVAGVPGAIAGFAAMVTPAFLVLPLMYWAGKRADSPRVKSAIRAVVIASAGLLLSVSMPLARDAITGTFALVLVLASALVLAFTKTDSAWVMLGAALIGLAAKLFS